jgi:hypothetical protein
VLFETIIAVLRPLANQGCGVSGGHHPATCASATNSATVMMNNTASASVIGHMTRPSNCDDTCRCRCHRVQTVFELRRDIAKETALRRLGPPLTNY